MQAGKQKCLYIYTYTFGKHERDVYTAVMAATRMQAVIMCFMLIDRSINIWWIAEAAI